MKRHHYHSIIATIWLVGVFSSHDNFARMVCSTMLLVYGIAWATSSSTIKTMKTPALILAKINSNPALLDLLFELDLMPEQVTDGSRNWLRMIAVAALWSDEGRQRLNEALKP